MSDDPNARQRPYDEDDRGRYEEDDRRRDDERSEADEYEADYDRPHRRKASKQDERMWATFCHLSGILLGWLGPLIFWLIKRDESRFIDDQGKEALNFQLTMLIGFLIGIATSCIIIGIFIIIAVWIVDLIFCIMGAIAANRGERYRYPLTIRFIS
jgi:uncharacterized Tic20 family protein